MIELPEPRRSGGTTLTRALATRRSVRHYADGAIDRASLGQLLWAAQGLTSDEGGRTAPSAGATYPMEVYAVTAGGVFHYRPATHALHRVHGGDARPALQRAALGQDPVGDAPLVVLVAADPRPTERRYASRAERYVLMEAGHVAQNVLLTATALDLGAVPIGAFDDAAVARAAHLPEAHRPLYLIPVGRP
ncbi:MAG TPA: SagB/ThcOx family dehydrogenase [Sandaracinaceae bacterium LLY-WYZ-13_1]|nr:SagB/ThcOx family dehydrogenase [Sandaracinaceae bacterium LLY-WYZ-13_1]